MNVARLIDHLESLGIRLWLQQDELRYRAPPNGMSAAVRGEILERKAEIIAFLDQANVANYLDIQPVLRDESTPLPVSFSQQRLWFLAQLEDANNGYNIPGEFRLRGSLDVAALRVSFRQIEERHEALRTSFPERDGQAFQRINLPGAPFEIIDLMNLPVEKQEAERKRLSLQSAKHVFDLAKGPLWRVQLLRLSEDSHVLLMPMHHIISDQWSLSIMLRELSVLYALNIGEACEPLPELRIQYADFALWQRRWLDGERVQGLMRYWKDQLEGAPPLLSLPSDFPRPAVQSADGHHFYFDISKTVMQGLKRLSHESAATLFMTLESAFAILLGRYARQEEVSIGAPIANRPGADTENLIGLFLNAIVLRNNLSGNPTFREMLGRVRQVALAAYRMQSLPFEMLVETLQPQRSLAHAPVFQVMFNLLSSRESGMSFSGVAVERLEPEYPVAKYDLMLTMQEHEHGLHGAFEYSTDLFASGTIEKMAGHFQVLLDGIVENPDQIISRLPMLSHSEREQILYRWNESRSSDFPVDKCYSELFEAQAARTPEATAIVFTSDEFDSELSYRELDEQSNRFARYISELGVRPEVLVGVCMDRSPETIISLLAIFKAGGAYVPLDLSLPAERVGYMLAKSNPAIVITKDRYAVRFAGHGARILCLDRAQPDLAGFSNLPIVNRSTNRNLAYVLFTSGSTGVPKGVMIEQRGMVNNLFAKIADHGITRLDKIAQTAPPSFDISMWQFLAALLCGGAVRIFGDAIARDPGLLIRHTQAERITILEVVPSLFRFMLDELAAAGEARPDFPALRWLSLTGEALPSNLCNAWLHYYPKIPILNAYGPAECSDDATHHIVNAPFKPAVVPIGRPIPHVCLYVLDTELEPVPAGVPGELYIGGIGVGRGYIDDPERTAECFIADCFVPGPGAHLYKTGDLARFLHDGTLEFLGRLDHQVKLRGLRIELQEIEAILEQHPDVDRAAAAIQPATDGGQELVAYLTLKRRAGQELRALSAEWRSFMAERLPGYMVPGQFAVLDAMPLNPNGKLDRKALPAIDIHQRRSAKMGDLPRTETEKFLSGIWQEVLRIPQIGVEENFFEIGGHSLLATQVASRIRRHWRIEMPLRKLFEAPTINQLAGQIERMQVSQMLQQQAEQVAAQREEVAL